MARLPVLSLFKIIFESRTSYKFLVGTIGSFAFSMAVILCTIGLMDGFEFTLKKALSQSNGDIKFIARDGFFLEEDSLKNKLNTEFSQSIAFLLQIEAFALTGEEGKGVLVKGISKDSFAEISGLDISSLDQGVLIGKQFAETYQVKVGDNIVLALSSSKAKNLGSAILKEMRVDGIVHHGIYEKDFRFIYIDKKQLETMMTYREGVSNFGMMKIKSFENLNFAILHYKEILGDDFSFSPFWSEFEVLIEAVEYEKVSISVVLQLIVIVSILNVIAFLIYISETKAQAFFMLRTLGLNFASLQRFWISTLVGIWGLACLFSLVLVFVFDQVILKLPFLKIPGDIYVLSDLSLLLGKMDYIYVFGVSLIWIILIGFVSLHRMKRKPLISGLRQEFS